MASANFPIIPPLARQESNIIQYVIPTAHGNDSDGFLQESKDPIPLALANKGKGGAINNAGQDVGEHGNIRNQSAARRSSDTLRDEHRKGIILKDDESIYNDGRPSYEAPSIYSDRGRLYEAPSRDLEKGDQVGKDSRPTQSTQWENNVVGWDGPNDPLNPQNWKKSKKYTTTVFYASMTFCITFASSVFSTATPVTAKLFGVSTEVMTLGTSLFVLVSASSQLHPSNTDTCDRASRSVP